MVDRFERLQSNQKHEKGKEKFDEVSNDDEVQKVSTALKKLTYVVLEFSEVMAEVGVGT